MTLSAFAQIRRLSGDTSLAASVARFNLAHPEKVKASAPGQYELACEANTKAKYGKPANGIETTEPRQSLPDSGQMWVAERTAADFFPKTITGDNAAVSL